MRAYPPEYIDAFRHHLPLQVRFSDVDRLGHVNNSVFQQFFDLGRLHYLRAVLPGELDWEEDVVVLAHLDVDYLYPILWDIPLVVATRTIRIGQRSFRTEQIIYNADSRRIHSRAISVMVGFNGITQAVADIRPAWKQALQRYDNPTDPS